MKCILNQNSLKWFHSKAWHYWSHLNFLTYRLDDKLSVKYKIVVIKGQGQGHSSSWKQKNTTFLNIFKEKFPVNYCKGVKLLKNVLYKVMSLINHQKKFGPKKMHAVVVMATQNAMCDLVLSRDYNNIDISMKRKTIFRLFKYLDIMF